MIDFPAAPEINDEYFLDGRWWTFNGTGWVSQRGTTVIISATEPVTPDVNQLWLDIS